MTDEESVQDIGLIASRLYHWCRENPDLLAVSERLLRREAVENSIADLRLEGLAPTADAQLLFEQFIQGELTEEQLVNAILAR